LSDAPVAVYFGVDGGPLIDRRPDTTPVEQRIGDNRSVLFSILGGVEARRADGAPVPLGGPRPRSLLALLLLDAGHVVGVERLIDGLYGDHPPAGAANALQSQISRLRRGLRDAAGQDGLVELHPAGYRLAVDPEDVDAHRFERLARQGRRALAAALLRTALDLWRGPALADVRDAPFAPAQAARLEELRAAAVEDRAEAGLALGEHRSLVTELQELVRAHPLRERARGRLMRALYGSGRQAEALAVFEDVRHTLAEELGADPSAELTAVHLAVLRAEPEPAPARPAAAAPAGLPAQITSFVGRDKELSRIGELLAERRLVTLTGPGGAGKTRLAVEAGERVRGEVCFVDLVPVDDGAGVPQALLSALGIRDTGLLPSAADRRPDPADRLIAALTDRRMLLILDNCEHVIDDAARIAHRLLGACPDLRVLATSREALGITGESLHPLPALALPPPGTAPQDALGYSAVRLFADRAAAVRPDFEVHAGNADAVLRICAALDGLPLAIELAAARLRSLTVEDVAARLDDRFRLLSRGSRTAAPRHQTLRAVVEWSWDLLDEAEQTLARRLTVFGGGVTREAAERVCGLPADEVDELLAGLADKSLVQGDGGRYRMLETVRAFGAERLAAAGGGERSEEELLRRAHAEHFLDLARTADPRLRGPEQLRWLARLTEENANLQAALRFAVHTDPDLALRLFAELSWYWWLRGLRGESAPPAAELLETIGTEPPADLTEEYVLCVLNAVSGGSPGEDLRAHMRTAESIVESLDSPPRQPVALVLWAMANPIPTADTVAQRRQRMLIGPDPWLRALDEFSLGYQHVFAGEAAEAEPVFRVAIERFRALGDRWGTANALDGLALLAEWRGDRESSLALLGEALDLVEQLGALEDVADLLCRRADVLLRGGDLATAHADYERATEFAGRAGAPLKVHTARLGLGEIARLRGDLAEARRRFETVRSESTVRWGWAADVVARALVGLGWVAEAEGDAAEARSRHRQALDLSLDRPHLPAAADAVEGMAGVALLEGAGERVALLLGAARALRGAAVTDAPDVARVSARARDLIGDAAYAGAYERGTAMTTEEALSLAGA
jgi:predicted ATPase/DNA-binding SARP family transcriptional activator